MKFKQVLAGLLVGAMVVTSAPVSGLGALSALAADEGGSTETKSYTYTKLQGLTISADCGNGDDTPTPDTIVDGNEDTYWHSAWKGDKQPERHAEVQMNQNNNITLTLSDPSAVKKLEYVANAANLNGRITKCNIYYKTSAADAEFQKVGKEPYTLNFTDEAKAEIEFTTALSDVKEIKIEVLNTAGNPSDMFISGKELYIYSDDSTKVDSKKISAKAECSSQKERGLKNLVDNNEDSIYHSSWYGSTGNVEENEGFDAVVRPGTTTISTELISRNNLYINLSASKTVGKLTYLPRQGSGNRITNGRITTANIYVSNSDTADASTITEKDWTKVATVNWENDAKKKEATFSPEMAKHIRIEVKHSAGDTIDKFISAAEVEVYEATEEEGTPAEEYTALPASALTGTADSVEMSGESSGAQGKAEQAVDGKEDTYWHSQYKPSNNVVLNQDDPTKNKNNNYYVELDAAYTVSEVTYVPRTKDGQVTGNGCITKCNVYTSKDNGANWEKAGASEEWTYTGTDVKKTITFEKPVAGVTNIKFEVLSTKGETGNDNKFINAAEFGIIGKKDAEKPPVSEDKVIEAPVLTAVAPVKGAKPANVTAADTEGYTVKTAWTGSDNAAVTTFEAGKEYTLTATLTATEGYKFTETSKPSTIKVGEGDVDVTADIKDGGKTMTLTHKFTVPAETVQYAKLTGLTGAADSEELKGEQNGNGPAAKAVDGKTDTFWHTNWSDATKPKPESSGGKLTGHNTYTITLKNPSTVTEFTYMPRNLYTPGSGVIASGAITEGKVLIQTKDSTEWIEAGTISGWTYPNKDAAGAEENFKEKKVTFKQAYSGVTKVKVEVTQTAGNEVNKHINAAEFGVIGKEDAETPPVSEDKAIKAPVLTAVAPVKGAKPADVTAAGAEGYTVKTAWTDSTGGAVTTFEAGKDYTLTATLTADKGYKFTETSKPSTIKVGKEDVAVTATIGGDGKTMTLTHKFTVPAETVQYAKLTGLTGAADSQELTGEPNGNGPIAKALDGDLNTYWHTNWKDDSAPKATTDGTKLTGNNNYIITLAKPSTVTSVTYVPRNGYEKSSGKVNNGAIEQCNVYVTTDGTKWTLAGTIGESNAWRYVNQGAAGADQNFVEKTVTFDKAYADVTKVKIVAIKTAGPQPNEFINAAEFGVIGKGDGTPGEVTCNCALSEITGVQDQTVELDVADSKSVKLKPTATATP